MSERPAPPGGADRATATASAADRAGGPTPPAGDRPEPAPVLAAGHRPDVPPLPPADERRAGSPPANERPAGSSPAIGPPDVPPLPPADDRERAPSLGWLPESAEGAAHLYLASFRVQHHQLDPLGHVNNAVYVNFLEQAAIDHAAAAGYDVERLREIGGFFIARRHEIDYLRPAFAGDRLEVRTWALALRGARAHRAYELWRLPAVPLGAPTPPDRLVAPADLPPPSGELIVRARTEWAFVDAVTHRPRRIPPTMATAFLRG